MALLWLQLILLLLAVVGTEGVEEPAETSSNYKQCDLIQLIFEERLQRRLLEAKVQEVLDSNRVLQAKVDNLTDEIPYDKKLVAFSVRVGRNIPVSEKGIIRFELVTTNIGSAYNVTTGIFRCPVNGLYLFSSSILATTPGFIIVKILQNGNIIVRPHSGNNIDGGHNSGSDTAVVYVNAGDEVYVKITGDNRSYLDHMSSFSGVLLKTD